MVERLNRRYGMIVRDRSNKRRGRKWQSCEIDESSGNL